MEQVVIRLVKKEPYYGAMLLEISYVEAKSKADRERVPTAGINKKGQLIYNPEFLDKIDINFRVGLIKHELMHLLFRHPAEMEMYPNPQRWNVACDVAINQMIPEIPRQGDNAGLFPENFGFPLNLTAEEYYDLLPKDPPKLKVLVSAAWAKAGSKDKGIPEHVWEIDPETAQEMAEKLEAALDRESTRQRGTMPAHLQNILNGLQRLRQINWKHQLRNIVKRHLRADWKTRWKRPDRRFGQIPCRTRDKKPLIGVAVDTSGSTLGYRAIFAGEMDTLRAQTGCDMVCVECDAAVGKQKDGKDHYFVKAGGKWNPPTQMTGGGGTAFQPALDWFETNKDKHKIGVLIYLTDGYGEFPRKAPSMPVVWVECGPGPDSAAFGRHIKIGPKDLPKE